MSIRFICYSGTHLISTYKVIDVLLPVRQGHVRRRRQAGSSRYQFSPVIGGGLLPTTASLMG